MQVSMSGGDALNQHLKELVQRLKGGEVLRVGFLENATYPDNTPVALVAAVHEYGSPTVPARPFFRPMLATKAPGWGVAFGKVLKATGYDLEKSMGLMGELLRGQLQESIRTVQGPALKPSTVRAKGFNTLLIDTAHMLNSVDYDVKTTSEGG
jgi:hypothetical protein